MTTDNFLVLRAIHGTQLTVEERTQLTPTSLAQLAIGKHIELARAERDRIPEALLGILVVGRNFTLDPGEINRFSDSIRNILEISLRDR